MKKEYNIKDTVWIHIGEKSLTQGRVVDVIDLEHLGESHSKDNELYIIELKTGIEDVYEVRSYDLISPDANGPISMFRNTEKQNETIKGNRFMKSIGVTIPATNNTVVEIFEDLTEELEPTPDQIHAALERSQQSIKHDPLPSAAKPVKKKYYKKRSPKQ